MTEAGAHHQGDGDERQDDHGKKMSCCTTQATAGQEDAMLWFGLWVCRVYLPIVYGTIEVNLFSIKLILLSNTTLFGPGNPPYYESGHN